MGQDAAKRSLQLWACAAFTLQAHSISWHTWHPSTVTSPLSTLNPRQTATTALAFILAMEPPSLLLCRVRFNTSTVAHVVEFPRKLEWTTKTLWVAKVRGTSLHARIEARDPDGDFVWYAWNGPCLISAGAERTLEKARDKVRASLEQNVLVVRVLPPGD